MRLVGLSISELLMMIIAVILSMSVHELAHGLVSYWLGDPSAKYAGRLSLNPLRHIDWLGMLCLLAFGFGWAKPVPIDSRYYKDPKSGIIWTSFAGPLANFLLAFVCVFVYFLIYKFAPYGMAAVYVTRTLALTASMSIGFGIFNLIPIPPLDGAKILWSFLPDHVYYRINNGAWWMNLLLFALIYSGLIGGPMAMLRTWFIDLFSNISVFLLGI